MTFLLGNNEPGTKTDEPKITISSSAPDVISRKENYSISQTSMQPQLQHGRDQQASTFEAGNLNASNLAPQIAATGSTVVSAIHPQYPSEASCGQVSGNMTGTPEGLDYGVPNK